MADNITASLGVFQGAVEMAIGPSSDRVLDDVEWKSVHDLYGSLSDADKLADFNAALKELQSGGAPAAIAAHEGSGGQPGTGAAPPPHQGGSVQAMVAQLAERLKVSGADPQGWLMLVRSYATLGEKGKAATAVTDARQALAAHPEELNQFNQALASVNLDK